MLLPEQATQLQASTLARRAALEKAVPIGADELEAISPRDYFSFANLLGLLLRKERVHEVATALGVDVNRGVSKDNVLRQLARAKRFGATQRQRLCAVLPYMRPDELRDLIALGATLAETDVEVIDSSVPEELWESYAQDPVFEWDVSHAVVPERLEAIGDRSGELARELIEQAYDEPAERRYRALRDVIEDVRWRDCFSLVRWRGSKRPFDDDDIEVQPDANDPLVQAELERARADEVRARALLVEAIAQRRAIIDAAEPVTQDAVSDVPSRDFFSCSRLLEILFYDRKDRMHELARSIGVEPKRSNSTPQAVALQLSRARSLGATSTDKLLAISAQMSLPELRQLIELAATVSETPVSAIDARADYWWFEEDEVFQWNASYLAIARRLEDLGEHARELTRALISSSYSEPGERRHAGLRSVIESERWRACFRLVKWRADEEDPNETEDPESAGESAANDGDAATLATVAESVLMKKGSVNSIGERNTTSAPRAKDMVNASNKAWTQ